MVKKIYDENIFYEMKKISSSGKSLVIIIPKEWAELNNLKLSDEIKIGINKNKIIIFGK